MQPDAGTLPSESFFGSGVEQGRAFTSEQTESGDRFIMTSGNVYSANATQKMVNVSNTLKLLHEHVLGSRPLSGIMCYDARKLHTQWASNRTS